MNRIKRFIIYITLLILVADFKILANQTLQEKIAATSIDTAKVDLFNQAAESFKSIDEDKALEYAKNALTISLNKNYKNGIANAYYHIGDIYKTHGKQGLSLDYFNKSVQYFKEINDTGSLIKVYNKIGVIYFNKNEFNKAITYYNKALKLSENLNDYQAYAGILNNIGNIYYTQGKYNEAIDYYNQSLKLRENYKDTNGIAGSLHNIASIYYAQGMYDNAEKMYLNAITLRENIGNKKGVALSYSHLGILYSDLNRFDDALAYQLKAIDIYNEIQDKNGLANAYANLGNIYRELKDNKKSLEYFDKALQLYNEVDDINGQANLFISKGSLLINLNKLNEAIKELEKGKKMSEQFELNEIKRKAYMLLYEAYEKINDYKNAYSYLKLYNNLKDSINTKEITGKLAEIEKKYEFDAQKKQIEVLQKEKENQELKLRQNTNRITILLISLIALTTITLLVVISNRHKQKTNKLLSAQNEDILRQKNEKEVLLKEIHHRVKNNLQVINSLLRLQAAMIDDPKVVALFEDCQARVRSMALIHDKLYAIKDLSSIQVKEYIENLTQSLIETYGLKNQIELKLNIEPLSFSVDTLIPLGLLLNEIISNSLKYAFMPNDKGIIQVSIKAIEKNKFELLICDNGKGFSKEIFNHPQNSLGIELIKSFVEQLDGSIEKLDVSGTSYRIIFKNISK